MFRFAQRDNATFAVLQPFNAFTGSRPVCSRLVSAGDRFAHGSVGLDMFHSDIIHNPEVSRAKSVCHCLGNERFSFDHFSSHFLGLGAHFLFDSHCGCATRLSASACSVCNFAPMLSPTSTSAMSIERISNAVLLSSPLARTVLEMRSGFSSTSL